jgi:hypothetical protein
MCPWWLAATIAVTCLFLGLLGGIWLTGGIIADGPAEQPELPEEDTEPGGHSFAPGRFPMH